MMTKSKAALIHFLISFFVIALFLSWVMMVWYEWIFIDISGVLEPAKMLVLVDVVLGPLLTFIIYKAGKKNLKLDLSLIVLVQLLAFGYGAYTLFAGKPSLVVMKNNMFEVVIQKQVDQEVMPEPFKSSFNPLGRPHYVKIKSADVNIFNSAMSQQNALESMEFTDSSVKAKALDKKHVLQVVAALQTDESQSDADAQDYYLLIDDDQYAVLVVDAQGQPVRIELTDDEILGVSL
ncbi:hypothetical protein ACFODZ_11490 [Marinicella sediminis]|uniref:Type IV pilin accessory protein n=1 Tax=Marinicella sediminis TaxID=1792834 RepID=A0ABV7JDM8_9GAMM|nr:hypothetical protein [Marinicella sediminis]